jgi:dTDP-4-dehydrorhamnose reductase
MFEKTLVIGAGFLGNCIYTHLKKTENKVIKTHFQENNNSIKLDVRDEYQIEKIICKTKPDLIINCSANTNVELLETNLDEAISVNATGARNIAKIANKQKIRMIQISTDSVFDGKDKMYTEEDSPNPINNYAKSKLMGEKYVQETTENYVIIRTNFYGVDVNNNKLFSWILKNLQERNRINGFVDVIFTPVEVNNLSDIILDISTKKYCGLIHCASNESINKYQFAIEIAKNFNLDQNLIKKSSIDDFLDFKAKRPKNTTLSNNKMKKISNIAILECQSWLKQLKKSK